MDIRAGLFRRIDPPWRIGQVAIAVKSFAMCAFRRYFLFIFFCRKLAYVRNRFGWVFSKPSVIRISPFRIGEPLNSPERK